MKIKTVTVTSENVMDVITNPKVFVIRQGWLNRDYVMRPIKEADVKDLFASDVAIIEIVE